MPGSDELTSDAASPIVDWGRLTERVEKFERDLTEIIEEFRQFRRRYRHLKGRYNRLARRYNRLKENFAAVAEERERLRGGV